MGTKTTEYFAKLFIHNQLGDFFRQSLQWICSELMIEKPSHAVIATYDKAVARFKQIQEKEQNQDVPLLPLISLNPTSLNYTDKKTLLYQHSQLAPANFVTQLYDPIAEKNGEWALYPMFQELQGSFDITLWLPSTYSVYDHILRVLDFFGGSDRPIRPTIITSNIILPKDLLVEEYTNEYTNKTYTIDLSDATHTELIKTLNMDCVVAPVNLTPYYRLDSVSDNSDKLGSDALADWKVTISINWKCSFPIWLILALYTSGPFKIKPRINTGSSVKIDPTATTTKAPDSTLQTVTSSDYINDPVQNPIEQDISNITDPTSINSLPPETETIPSSSDSNSTTTSQEDEQVPIEQPIAPSYETPEVTITEPTPLPSTVSEPVAKIYTLPEFPKEIQTCPMTVYKLTYHEVYIMPKDISKQDTFLVPIPWSPYGEENDPYFVVVITPTQTLVNSNLIKNEELKQGDPIHILGYTLS